MKNLVELLAGIVSHHREGEESTPAEEPTCPGCGLDLSRSAVYQHYRVCEGCRRHLSLSARERIEGLADPRSFKEINRSLTSVDPLAFADRLPYRQRLDEARKRTGLTDAVVTGFCRIGGRGAIIAALDFDFLGGSMGCVLGEKMALAFELAIKRRLPLIAITTSGGARMQEGMLSLVQMAKTAAAAQRLHNAQLPYIVVLANPTTGGVFASFANLADIILAEPGALIGFAGPRVVEQTTGEKLPQDSHTAEFLLRHGMVDLIVERTKLRDLLSLLLELTSNPYRITRTKGREPAVLVERPAESAWQTVQLARHEQRPTALDYIGRITSHFVELHGDRLYGDDPAIVGGLAELGGEAVVVVGQERGHGEESQLRHEGRPYPEGYRKAQRLMALAAKLRLPLITLIDTPGAYPGLASEERGLAHAIAQCLATMSDLPTPIISVVIGEGGSGGALALGVADRTLMLEHAIYSVIAPEGAAAILYRDAAKAPEVTPALKLTAHDCKTLGVIDLVVPEPEGGAHADPEEAAHLLKDALLGELVEVQSLPVKKLVRARYDKFRRMGEFNSYFGAVISREVAQLQETFQRLRRRAIGAPNP